MALATAAVAGAATLAGYLDAKFHLSKDLKGIVNMKLSERETGRARAAGKLNLWYAFEEAAKKYPDTICVWSREGIYTFQQTYDLAVKYANYFISLGIQRGQLIGFYLQNSPEFLFAWLGSWCIGCAPAALNYNLTGDALVHCLKISGAHIVLVDEDPKCAARIEADRSTIENELKVQLISLGAKVKSEIANSPGTALPDESYRLNADGGFPAVLIYTSGTTGLPKGCAITIERLHGAAASRKSALNETPGTGGDRWYNCMPMYHGTGGLAVVATILGGRGAAIGKRFSVSNFWKDIHDSEATFFIYVGETARYLLAAPPSPLDKGHKVRCAYGNGLRPDVWDRFKERFDIPEILEFFNSTEGLFALVNYQRSPFLAGCVGHHGAILRAALRNVYIPVAIDPTTGDILRDPVTGFATRTTYNEGGEMIVAVPNQQAFQGYWRNPDATLKKFARDVFKKGDLYYRSGDALRRTDDGRWHFLDRLGDTFRWKSENVSTAEVGLTIGHFPGVNEANVYGVLVPNHDGRAGCAALELASPPLPTQPLPIDLADLLAFARERLPKYAVPVFLRVVTQSSHIHNHKQNKVPLRAEGVDPDLVGTKVGDAGKTDRFFWLKPGGKGYEEFKGDDWQDLKSGRLRL